jgi:gliding motility-associated protein GldM
MAGYKETPRQKMIAMMYLVLTALLALNVSKQILDSFILVNESMETTNSNFSKKLENTYDKFKIQYQMNPNKVAPFWEKAQAAHVLSRNLVSYIDSLRAVIVMKTEGLKTLKEGREMLLKDVWKKDNYNVPTYYFVGSSSDGSQGEAKVLKGRLENYKKQLLDLVDPRYRASIKMGMDTKGPFYNMDGKKETWEMHNFYRTILAADVTILNKLIAEAYNAEFDIINNLMASISAEDFKYNKVAARVIPKSGYVFLGDDYQAEIVVAAYDTKSNPDVRYVMGSDTLTNANFRNATALQGSNGVVTLKIPGSGEGLRKYAGIIKLVGPLGDTLVYHFKDEFIVGKPGITISPTKMNVFYVGVDNPVEISVPGGPERVIPTISVGSIRPEGKDWIVSGLPKNAREAIVSVNAVFAGKTKSMGNMKFRLKSVPDPVVKVGGKSEGFISKSILLASPYVTCEMPVGFDFDIRYSVTAFTFVTDVSGDIIPFKVSAGNRFTPEIMKIIEKAGKNKRFWIEQVSVKGPDERTVTGIGLKIN